MSEVTASESSPRPISRLALAALLCAFLVWAGWFIFRTSLVVGGERHFVLFDDAMISMTYARNLVEGHGLNWAREGEPVEGFTTPLWTALMVPVNATPLPLVWRSLAMQLLSLGALLANLALLARLTGRHLSFGLPGSWVPVAVLTACYFPLDYWSLLGMETGLQALLTTAAVYLAYQIVETGEDRALALGVVLALAYLTRMDMVLMIAAVGGYVVLHGGLHRAGRSRWIAAGAVLASAVLGYQLFRGLYFGDPLPNTYYLKLAEIPLEVRLLRGLSSYVDFVRAHGLLLAAIAVGVLPLLRSHRRLRLPVAIFALYSLYSIWVGGDAWEGLGGVAANRFLAFVVPLLFAALGGALNLATASSRPHPGVRRSVRATVTLLLVLSVNGLVFSPAAEKRWQIVTAIEPPPLTTSHQLVIEELYELQERLVPGARVATFWAGAPAYFSDYRMVDMFGYSDRHIARLPPARKLHPRGFRNYTPGHAKWDYRYVLEEKKPDAFFQAWGMAKEGQSPLLTRAGYVAVDRYWVREDSPFWWKR